MKKNIIKKQIVLGKEYKSAAFLASPSQVVFKDFEVGREEVQRVTLSNVSWTFNTFRILDFNVEISDFFEVTYDRPGEMSAGMTCDIFIRFTPKINQDINDEIKILTKTGHLSIPLIASTKKVAISVTPEKTPGVGRQLDLGQVVLAESVTRTMTITNSGALSTKLELLGDVTTHPEISISPSKYSSIHIAPHSTEQISITFAPKEVQPVMCSALLHFSSPEVEDIIVSVVGEGAEVPVYIHEDSTVLDFSCCYVDTLYRDELVVCNRGRTSIRVKPSVPHWLRPYLEYIPKFGFIQPGSSLSYQLKFRPSRSILKFIDSGKLSPEGALDIKIPVTAYGQALPISYQLRGLLTTPDLQFSELDIDFGPCTANVGVSKVLTVTNLSDLPQEIGFIETPVGISVEPNNGFANMQPKEKRDFQICYKGSNTSFNGKVVVKTERNETHRIKVTATSKRAPLQLSSTLLKFPSAELGERLTASLLLKNVEVSGPPQLYSVQTPDNSFLTVSPACGEVSSGEVEPLLLTFRPTLENLNSDLLSEWTLDKSDTLNPSYHLTCRIPCYLKDADVSVIFLEARLCITFPRLILSPLVSSTTQQLQRKQSDLKTEQKPDSKSGKKPQKDDKKANQKGAKPPVPETKEAEEDVQSSVAENIQKMLANPPEYSDCESTITWLKEVSTASLHFGEVPAFKTTTCTFQITNLSPSLLCDVSIQPLDPFGPFALLKPPVPLRPGHTCEVVIQFCPSTAAVYTDEFIITCNNGNAKVVTMKGVGLEPALAIALDSETISDLAAPVDVKMGAVLSSSILHQNGFTAAQVVSEVKKRQLTLTSKCTFDIPFSVTFVESSVEPLCASGSIPFVVQPSSGIVPAGECVKLSLEFQPDHESDLYRGEAICEYGGLDKNVRLHFTGTSWNTGVYVQCPTALDLQQRVERCGETVTQHHSLCDDFFSGIEDQSGGGSSCGESKKHYQLDFYPTFSRERLLETEAKHTIFVGNAKTSDAKGSVPGEVFFDPKELAEAELFGFRFSNMPGGRVTIPPGTETPVEISFSPKDSSGYLSQDVYNQLPVPGVLLNVETQIKLCLKGGWPASDAREITLLLKGNVKIPDS
eukprot:TRINITY_DN21041_c0_g1_i1.p1 TRINITY_DN21041_c0_g1~~TRINITY_DN21041_c0_g1_i1.p1  ORF type:complete len:1196 (+),score=169.17 TRINITY_DN21041_c0_g1_i1:287-3589(+)